MLTSKLSCRIFFQLKAYFLMFLISGTLDYICTKSPLSGTSIQRTFLTTNHCCLCNSDPYSLLVLMFVANCVF